MEFKFGGGVSGLFIKECWGLLLETLEQSQEFANLQEIKLWQCASAELATCTACEEGRRTGPRVLLHALHHYVLHPT